MDVIKAALKTAATRYNKLLPHHDAARELIFAAHSKLIRDASYRAYGDYAGKPRVPYNVFAAAGVLSRPVRPSIYIADAVEFARQYDLLRTNLRAGPQGWSDADATLANSVVYTSVMAVAACYDLWQRGSRKTPGTFFEILMAALLQDMLPKATFSKHIPLTALLDDADVAVAPAEAVEANDGDEEEGPGSLSTDLVIRATADSEVGVVIPLKITTRERIVQPFAHQRILDSAFGEGAFKSLLVCMSETQLDDKTRSVKQVCVPGTVKLFQKYLAPLSGLYYCDVPQRYAAPDMQRVLPVKSVGHLFLDLAKLLN